MRPAMLLLLLALLLPACAGKPPLVQTGFLNDYSRLETAGANRMVYLSPELREYGRFFISPVELLVPAGQLDEASRAELAHYFSERIAALLRARQKEVAPEVGPGVARVRVAITGVANSTWWQKVHPGMRMTGAGTGGAAVEGEILDSVTGEQLAAWVAADSGNQFDFTAFSTVADVKNVIDRWIAEASARLDALSAPPPSQ